MLQRATERAHRRDQRPGQTLTIRIYVGCGSPRVGLASTSLAAYPNPVQSRLNVSHTAASRDARMTVFSTTGAWAASFTAGARFAFILARSGSC